MGGKQSCQKSEKRAVPLENDYADDASVFGEMELLICFELRKKEGVGCGTEQ